MAENKKSFIAYSDWYGTFKALPDELAGKLIKHIFSYVNDENPKSEDYVINALFEQFKATLKRDLNKWERQREQRSLAGKRSAEKRATKFNDRSTTVNEKERKSTVSVSVSDSVSDTIIDNSIMLDIKPEDVPKDELIYFKIAKGLLKFFIEHRKYRGLKVQKYLKEAKYGSYVTPIRLLVENDGYDLEDVKETARYLISDKVDDHFFKDVVLSTDKFRKQFENIQIKRMKYLRKLEIKKQNQKKGMV